MTGLNATFCVGRYLAEELLQGKGLRQLYRGHDTVTDDTWFVLFRKARVPTKEAVIAVLSTLRSATVTDSGELEFAVVTTGGSFIVSLGTLSYVLDEARDAVTHNRDSLEHADDIATYDARFELLFDHRNMGDLFAPLLGAAERLAKLTSGVVYESDNGVFQ